MNYGQAEFMMSGIWEIFLSSYRINDSINTNANKILIYSI